MPTDDPPESKSSEATLTEGAFVCLMAGMILFAVFAIAPRPLPESVPRSVSPTSVPQQVTNRGGDDGGSGVAMAVVGLPTPRPTPAATAVPPTAVPSRPAAASPTPARRGSYQVQQGDTLYSIARSFGVTADALAKANGLSNPKMLRVGQTLRIP